MKPLIPIFLLLAIISSGCAPGGAHKGEVVPADPLAASDPNAKARLLMDEFTALPEGERADWARNKGFDLAVFESATDPQLRSQYDTYIRPLISSQPQ